MEKISPMMAQWQECKNQAKDALLLFRLGDFYEAFHQDSQIISKELDLTLTQRQGISMCGAPFHSIDNYIDKLIKKGFKVAIAEQMGDPKQTKGLVERKIVRIITPATTTSSSLLQEKTNNYFLSITQIGKTFGLAILDLTTAEFKVFELDSLKEAHNHIYKLKPAEMLVSTKFHQNHPLFLKELSLEISFIINEKENRHFDYHSNYEKLKKHFHLHSLDGLGLNGKISAISAAGSLLTHLEEELHINTKHIQSISLENLSEYMGIDKNTLSHLELIEPLIRTEEKNTLLSLLDQTKTPMGGRLLKQWIIRPLLSLEKIHQRQDCVEEFCQDILKTKDLIDHLTKIRDIERLMIKVSSNFATPRDLLALKVSLEKLPEIKSILKNCKSPLLQTLETKIFDLQNIYQKIAKTLSDNPPIRIQDGNVIKKGFHKELDEIREISQDSKAWIANYQNILKEKTQIKTLKVGFTKVFGYYIDISKGQSHKAPSFFTKKQTLVNSDRFVTDELKGFEHKILSSQEKILAIETEIFSQLRSEVAQFLSQVLTTAHALANIDVLVSLSLVAAYNEYIRPLVDNSFTISIEEGRHPIIEKAVGKTEFIPNNTTLTTEENLYIITGPNMSGKSTYIRQVALLTILAQIGSFIPAKKAHIGIVDQVFSRIGASDNLAKGQSTFMVEMSQTANILNNATKRSLVILDEIGRGTSTYDGISIAWAVAEYLLSLQTKTLFATHYWELTALEEKDSRAVNYQVKVQETNEGIVFLHKIVRGGTDKSYGIHVAKLAGLPFKALAIAEKMLKKLETKNTKKTSVTNKKSSLPLLEKLQDHSQQLLSEIEKIDINNLSPMQALNRIYALQEKIKSEEILS